MSSYSLPDGYLYLNITDNLVRCKLKNKEEIDVSIIAYQHYQFFKFFIPGNMQGCIASAIFFLL